VTWGSWTNLVWENSNAAPVEVVITNLVTLSTTGDSDAMLSTYHKVDEILVMDMDPCTFEEIIIESDPGVWLKYLPTNT
jgi:hypothetical protein